MSADDGKLSGEIRPLAAGHLSRERGPAQPREGSGWERTRIDSLRLDRRPGVRAPILRFPVCNITLMDGAVETLSALRGRLQRG
jgi:hypothetical protein